LLFRYSPNPLNPSYYSYHHVDNEYFPPEKSVSSTAINVLFNRSTLCYLKGTKSM